MDRRDRFRFEYRPGVIRFGTGCVEKIGPELTAQGLERALVVCGTTVGATPAVMEPVTGGLGNALAGTFAETTPEKRLATARDGRDALRAHDADVLVAVGGGSTLDVAKVVSVLAASDRDPRDVGRELAETGSIPVPDGDLLPVVAVPTTLAGADLSAGAGVTAAPDSGLVDRPASGGVSDPRLMPRAVFYDPALVATTPRSVLAGSAMNGFDKGVETLYARTATPVTDATAYRGLRVLADALREFGAAERVDADLLEPVVEGTMLVQYGISRPDAGTLSLLHAFGHGLARTYDVQQGVAHGVVAPHALRYLFGEVDGRRDLLAGALGVGDAGDPAAAVVDSVTAVRDALGLPTRLRDVDGPTPGEFPDVARAVLDDALMGNLPRGLDPTVEDVEGVLRAAY